MTWIWKTTTFNKTWLSLKKLMVPEKTGDSRQARQRSIEQIFFPQKKANEKLFYNNLNKYNFGSEWYFNSLLFQIIEG